jgi:hypothetical protein
MGQRISCALLGAASLLSAGAAPDIRAQPAPLFSIDWYVISPGGGPSRNECFVLNGTTGQPAPGYSSGNVYALISGFWTVAPVTVSDEIFFNSFEECTP